MKGKKDRLNDSDVLGTTRALKRAAKRARELARQTNTPCYVMIKGKIVDLTERDAKREPAKSKSKKK